MSMKITCTCGDELTINKMRGKNSDIPTVKQCENCMVAAYHMGYVDGGLSATEKTTLASIITDATWPRTTV
jgi:hypothetical protein